MICQQMLNIRASRLLAGVTRSQEILPPQQRLESVSDTPSETSSFFFPSSSSPSSSSCILKPFLNRATNPRHFIQETCPCGVSVKPLFARDKRRSARRSARMNVAARLPGDWTQRAAREAALLRRPINAASPSGGRHCNVSNVA